jgi:hypothetical protein
MRSVFTLAEISAAMTIGQTRREHRQIEWLTLNDICEKICTTDMTPRGASLSGVIICPA